MFPLIRLQRKALRLLSVEQLHPLRRENAAEPSVRRRSRSLIALSHAIRERAPGNQHTWHTYSFSGSLCSRGPILPAAMAGTSEHPSWLSLYNWDLLSTFAPAHARVLRTHLAGISPADNLPYPNGPEDVQVQADIAEFYLDCLLPWRDPYEPVSEFYYLR
jgi:hypothetical protein